MASLEFVRGSNSVIRKIDKLSRETPTYVEVAVGYEADYALEVHENIEMAGQGLPRKSGRGRYWDPQGQAQAKFLEQPAREYKKDMAQHIREVTKQKNSLRAGMLSGAKILLSVSQRLVPVEYGDLKKSGYYKITNYVQ